MDTLLQDLRFALRSLRKSPGFALVAVLCLALGIATNTTLFSVFDAVVVRPLPFEDSDALVSVMERHQKNPRNRNSVNYLNFLEWRAQSKTLSNLVGYSGRSLTITEGEEPERLNGLMITWDLFQTLGVRPQLGRFFREDEDQWGARGAVILSDALWRRRYNADSSVLNRVISINNLPYTVVGVMPVQFKFPENSEIWIPIAPVVAHDPREWRHVAGVGRLAKGMTVEQADREFATIAARVNREYNIKSGEFVGSARLLKGEFLPPDVKLIVTTMYGAVGFVLLIACANVANLMLTRAAARQREMAIRTAIGAGRGRIIRQVLTEAVVLGLVAGALAVPLSIVGMRLIDLGIPPENPIPWYMHWSLDVRTLLYTIGVSAVAGMLFGLAPALQGARANVHESLKEGGRGSSGARKNRLRNTLVVVEVALSLVLLVGASLFWRSFQGLNSKSVGFDTAPILTMRFFLPGTRYDSTRDKTQRVQDILQRVERLPGVEAATVANLIPLDGGGGYSNIEIDGQPVEKGKEPFARWSGHAGHWFQTLGVTIVSGRDLAENEVRDSAAVAVINQAMSKRYWPKGTALGSRFRMLGDASHTWITVVGITTDMQTNQLDDTQVIEPTVYLPYNFLPARNNGLMLRTRGDPTTLAPAVRQAIRASDPGIAVYRIATLEKVRRLGYWQDGIFAWMFGVFGVIALFLAAIGVYGVISYGVSQRTQEIGVRVALGAQQRNIVNMVVSQGMTLAGLGLGFGLLGAFGVTRVVQSILVGVSATDPLSFGVVTLLLGGVVFVASYLPARRATGVDPIVALRAE